MIVICYFLDGPLHSWRRGNTEVDESASFESAKQRKKTLTWRLQKDCTEIKKETFGYLEYHMIAHLLR